MPSKGAGLLVSNVSLKFQKASGTAVVPTVSEATELVMEPKVPVTTSAKFVWVATVTLVMVRMLLVEPMAPALGEKASGPSATGPVSCELSLALAQKYH